MFYGVKKKKICCFLAHALTWFLWFFATNSRLEMKPWKMRGEGKGEEGMVDSKQFIYTMKNLLSPPPLLFLGYLVYKEIE
jgi:hypothetical protein